MLSVLGAACSTSSNGDAATVESPSPSETSVSGAEPQDGTEAEVSGGSETQPTSADDSDPEADPVDADGTNETGPNETDGSGESGDGVGVDNGDTDAEDSGDFPSTTLIVIGLIVVASIAAMALSRGRQTTYGPGPSSQPAPPPQPDQRQTEADELLGELNWLHDQLSLDVLRLEPTQSLDLWLSQRQRLVEMAIECHQQSQKSPNTDWSDIATAVANLGRSLDTVTRTRTNSAVDAEVVHETVSVANRHRAELRRLLQEAGNVTGTRR